MKCFTTRLLLLWCCWWLSTVLAEPAINAHHEQESGSQSWARLLVEAERVHLPTKFLLVLPSDFIHFEFDDLRTYAAEYHPGEHRMRLNRTLSLNAAGRVLKPLGKMTHKELEVLYHELFHAYMDYLMVRGVQLGETEGRSDTLLRFAKEQQVCRYGEVMITPIVQRTDETESRYLTEAESWEALNETWAVFVGWVVWNQMELQQQTGKPVLPGRRGMQQWIERFKGAFVKGEFRGYYVPEDPDERRLAQKRYLAASSQLSLAEALVLMEQVFGFSDEFVKMIDVSFGRTWQSTCVDGKMSVN
ncbi:MAG: hypothetical protein OEV01_07360 [Nitrospira sp.]|nr:hypothetical protein [Nitrospira sp.]MDH4302619.1 hypothetical protein [Nitrospira sp.]